MANVKYPVIVHYPPNVDIMFPIWGTVLPDSEHPNGRWSAGIVACESGAMLQFVKDPEILLHTGARLDFYRGPLIIFSVTICDEKV